MKLSIGELADLVKGAVAASDRSKVLTGFSSLSEASEGDVSFLGNEKYLADFKATQATAVLVPEGYGLVAEHTALITVGNPSAAFGELVKQFGPARREFHPGVHASAAVADSAVLDRESVSIGANAVVGEGAEIGGGSTVGAGAYIGRECRLGRDCWIHPNVTIADGCVLGDRVSIHSGTVIGSDGFGYEQVDGKHVKIDQVGIVQIDDDVEIGAGTTVDRARFGKTWIQEGVKIDNQCQIAHNVVIGKHSLLVAQVGIAGSTQIGKHVIFAAQTGAAGHLKIGDQAVIMARGGVIKDLPGGQHYMGFPAVPERDAKKETIALRRLPQLQKRVKELESRLSELGEGG
ncbi:MAG: UDP-3-O-(3-hydroxymyristoyl)glucosamine N-acyltransferase [Verrucomicrobiota bacterium]